MAASVSLVIGLTGGIGSGKSVVAGLLAEQGASVVDADSAAHQVYRAGTEGWHQIVTAFGRDILHHDGSISRKKLAAIVFHDAEARNKVNAIVHPQVRRLLSERIASLQRPGTNVVVAEVPLLIEAIRSESEWKRMFDQIWVVTAPEAQVIERVRARGRMNETTIRAVIDAQLTPEQRLPYADIVIDNSGSLDRLRDRVETLWQERCTATPP
jgi:dephospho-CoA kinase